VKDDALIIGEAIDRLKLAPIVNEYQNIEMRMISIYGKNSYEWLVTDIGCNIRGITTVPIYDTLGTEAMRFILD